jgi:hypothetical protein
MNVQKRAMELIELGRQEVVLDEQRLEANRARILAKALALGVVGAGVAASTSAGAAAGVATVGATTAGAGTATKAVAAVSLAKWAVAVVAVGGSVGGTYALTSRTPDAPVSSQPAPIASASPASRQVGAGPGAAEKETDSNLPREVEAKPAPSAPAAGAAAGRSRAGAGKISEHAELLRDARSALSGGDAARALTLLDAHPEVGRGPLGPEWAAARILVLCRLGRVAEAKQLGQRFLKSHASSPLAAQVAASCAAAK